MAISGIHEQCLRGRRHGDEDGQPLRVSPYGSGGRDSVTTGESNALARIRSECDVLAWTTVNS